jgi:murein DD-endopeptidase MepM/ murein hydrolase activator NlpD
MRTLFAKLVSPRALNWGFVPIVAIAIAGCSADATRFSEDGYAPRSPSGPVAAAPVLPPMGAPPPYQPSQYAPPTAPEVTGAVRAAPITPAAPATASGNWDWEGGTAVVLAQGETLDSVARKHGVPVQAIMQANAITNPASVVPGQRLVIPRYVVHGAATKVAHAAMPRQSAPAQSAIPAAAPAPAPANVAVAGAAASGSGQTLLPVPPIHTVAAGDTLSKISRQYRVKVKDIIVANGIQPDARLSVGTKLTIPVAVAASKGQPATKAAGSVKAPALAQAGGPPAAKQQQSSRAGAAPPPAVPTKTAAAEPSANARLAATADPPADDAGTAGPGGIAANGQPAFRWPLRGRVINNFGAKVNGAANDGIDLATPEGTPVRAADDGVVAYAGNELKGYGNLVLVRHANGFVTAYANASELMVKRNDQVHKGQVIAKSGQTGTAANPQLHFEVRKNSAPVDPMQYLPADKTASAPL